MKKDVVLALVIGLSIGALIAIAAVRIPFLLEQKNDTAKVAKKAEISPSVALKATTTFTITSPQDQSIIDDLKTKITGTASPNSLVIIETDQESQSAESDNKGNFSLEVKLSEGNNPIYVSSIDQNGDIDTKTLNLYHTVEKL